MRLQRVTGLFKPTYVWSQKDEGPKTGAHWTIGARCWGSRTPEISSSYKLLNDLRMVWGRVKKGDHDESKGKETYVMIAGELYGAFNSSTRTSARGSTLLATFSSGLG